MGKKVINLWFVLTFMYASYIFLSRDNRTLRENMEAVEDKTARPKILIENFMSLRYQNEVLYSKTSGDYGFFQEPNQLHMNGHLKSIRYRDNENQTVTSNTATATFNANSIQDVLDGADTHSIELSQNIALKQGEDTIFTDHATYDVTKDEVSSASPVRVESKGRWFTGDNGFLYDMSTSNVEVFGPIQGVVHPNDISQP